jgi:hypothetical protein
MTKELKIEFAPGAFDNFEGTQEELDELMAEIHRMFESGEALEKARPIDFENPSPEDMELIEHIMSMEEKAEGRTLQ